MGKFDALRYWDHRYATGKTSGAGSRGDNLQRKADQINKFIRHHDIESMVDWGFGDGHLLELLRVPDYLGVDISRTAVGVGLLRFGSHQFLKWNPGSKVDVSVSAELALSVDVIFHLVDDAVFQTYLDHLFGSATRFVVVYAPNRTGVDEAPHVRNRKWLDSVVMAGWELTEPDDGVGPWVFERVG